MTDSENKIIPSVIPSIYQIEKQLRNSGLSYDDILLLIQKRTKGRPSKKVIKSTLNALKQIETLLEGRGSPK